MEKVAIDQLLSGKILHLTSFLQTLVQIQSGRNDLTCSLKKKNSLFFPMVTKESIFRDTGICYIKVLIVSLNMVKVWSVEYYKSRPRLFYMLNYLETLSSICLMCWLEQLVWCKWGENCFHSIALYCFRYSLSSNV